MKRLLLIYGLVLLACQALIVNAQSLSVTYYHTDALGSVVAAIDENGDLRWKNPISLMGMPKAMIMITVLVTPATLKKVMVWSTPARATTIQVLDALLALIRLAF